jgi:hypothetical protein
MLTPEVRFGQCGSPLTAQQESDGQFPELDTLGQTFL